MNDMEKHNHCTHQIIELANKLKDEGHDIQLVNAALMAARPPVVVGIGI